MKYTDLALLSYLAIRMIISISQKKSLQRLPESHELELIREQRKYIAETQGANASS
jgi:hypothetical protein